MAQVDKQGRVLWSFYVRPEAKAAVEALAEERGESASETLRGVLRLGLQHAMKDPGRLDAQRSGEAPGKRVEPGLLDRLGVPPMRARGTARREPKR